MVIFMVVKKEDNKVKKESENKVVKPKAKPEDTSKFSLEQIAEMMGVSIFKVKSFYNIRGIDEDVKMTVDEAKENFKSLY